MADKTDVGGQPSMEKLEREGVSPRKCVSYEGLGEYQSGNGGSKPAKTGPALSSSKPMRTGRGY